MTDALDRLAPAAKSLLHLVDTALAEAGAPPDDPVWPLLRRVRALPTDAVATVAGWAAAPLEATGGPLRALARGYGDALDPLPAHPPWEGAGAAAYAVAWSTVRGHVTGAGPGSLVGRLAESATYVDELADWVRASRRAVAVALADMLDSAEAVTLVTGLAPAAGALAAGPQAAGVAAARLAAHVLAPVAEACDAGRRLHDDWHGRLGEVPLQPVRQAGSGPLPDTSTVRVGE